MKFCAIDSVHDKKKKNLNKVLFRKTTHTRLFEVFNCE